MKIIILIFVLISILLMGCESFEEQNKYFTKEEKYNWCKRNMPQLNISGNGDCEDFLVLRRCIDARISKWCYGEVWDMYCKISYPDNC